MTDKHPSQTTVNAGAQPDAENAAEEREFEIAGNVARKGQDPSPDDRERGETSDKTGPA
jgi:hypothetical protein